MSSDSVSTSSLSVQASSPLQQHHDLGSPPAVEDQDDFYVRYQVAHQREWLEFELLPNGKLRYANNSNYSREGMIRRETFLGPGVVEEFKRIIRASGIVHVNDSSWRIPRNKHSDRQEIECKLGSMHIAFTSIEIKSLSDINDSADPTGLTTFYYLTQDLKTLFHTLISSHFKSRPFG
uniref:Uncharacterized protein n=1 Tax=Entomoneis paludosa TaxID=265537 RepID=A0A7S2YFY1_9STRA|mmetsp:Transcript_31505/g.65798  ORF Transcript_31505/g.65798 Transcript_31505/m.65798 type:complete len:178 (+) Transcript_31505:198-731(+)|eukprot:CAMPEP_0172447490 /NCGR_PEP_ID=MMETSP1065-20121228/6794_1 /TAXON_ID=265537 /ORGANISM="Amphiprora paludosa, Strain CCMP125" /LENGTH=177 /DNA_ID=CAMNT_0013198809 /DNA_START=99 /DNA_END=632 /DNA_ORIENTATION=-